MFLKKILFFLSIAILFSSCKSSDLNTDTTDCIEIKIAQFLKNDVTNPPTQIWKWEVDTQVFYYITSDCCDQYNYLFNSNCEIVCAPDGGITGNGDGNCPEFSSEIIKILIWEDKRN